MSTHFTTRPELSGHFGMAASTHWLASQTALRMMEIGGNAFDAAAAAGFVLQVSEPHLNGPLGEVPIIFHDAKHKVTRVICGQGPAPKSATIERFQQLGVSQIPGTGLLATAIPGAFDAWALLLRDHGLLRLEDVLQPAIDYAAKGVPVTPRMLKSITKMQNWFLHAWPENARIYLDNSTVPKMGSLLKNPALSKMYQRVLLEATSASSDRQNQIDAARAVWRSGFVADAIHEFSQTTRHLDITGQENGGLLTGDDMANWRATYEDPVTTTFQGKTICKTGPWGQGPVLLQGLRLIEAAGLSAQQVDGTDFYHTLTEAMKLSYADRETYYCDPDFRNVPLDVLLSQDYAEKRAKLISSTADNSWRPGAIPGFGHPIDYEAASNIVFDGLGMMAAGVGEPTAKTDTISAVSGLVNNDTCHINVLDRFGNMVSATPSGGWMESSPVIPELGVQLGTRLQMMSLNSDAMDALEPGKRPRTTLTPTLVLNPDGTPYLACGTPGGDRQDQWQLAFLVRHLMFGQNLQQAIDAPGFGSNHWPDSFYPRGAEPGKLTLEGRVEPEIAEALREKGHNVHLGDPWSEGFLCVSRIGCDGQLGAAASPRGMQAYAVGR